MLVGFARILVLVSFDFPFDLIDLQREWFAADAARTAAAKSGDDAAFETAGQQLQDLTFRLQRKVREYEQPFAARTALRKAARDAMEPDGPDG
jgi:hypothetical protein